MCREHSSQYVTSKEKLLIEQAEDERDNARRDKEIEAALAPFRNRDLIEKIHAELDKTHKLDHAEKLFVFFFAVSGFMFLPEDRRSVSLRGDASTGKDNLVRTVLRHLPSDEVLFLTRGTQATMEDDIGRAKVIAYSEMNADREGGANANLIEVLKQLTEGGTRALKKDITKGFKEVKHSIQEQKSIIYCTTSTQLDPELDTRFVVVPITASATKTATVNDATLLRASGMTVPQNQESWIAVGISCLADHMDVVFPHLKALRPSGEYFAIDNPRSQRDLKRLVSLAKAIAWIHQEQRPKIEIWGQMYIVGHPDDFLTALILASPFFDLAYQEVDKRELVLYEAIRNEGRVCRDELVVTLKKDRRTLNKYSRSLTNRGLIKVEKDENGKVVYCVESGGILPDKWVSSIGKIRQAFIAFSVESWMKEININKKMPCYDTLLTPPFSEISDVESLRVAKILGYAVSGDQSTLTAFSDCLSPPNKPKTTTGDGN